MNRNRVTAIGALGVVLLTGASFAAIFYDHDGKWPESWPEALDPLREQAETIYVANGTQETVYQIPFKTREEFEQAWPHLLEVKSPGGVLILDDWPSSYAAEDMGPGVRLICPNSGAGTYTDQDGVTVEWKWPPENVDPTYAPPEYVVQEGGDWVPYDPSKRKLGFHHRARVDVMLVVDGEIVDLNRIRLPEDTKIVDRRFQHTVIDTDGKP